MYADPDGAQIPYSLPPFLPRFTRSLNVQVGDEISVQQGWTDDQACPSAYYRCGTGSSAILVQWKDGTFSCLCSSTSNTAENVQIASGSSSAFLFPSLWASWGVEVEQSSWNMATIDKDRLALQVQFWLIPSDREDSDGYPKRCQDTCDYSVYSSFGWMPEDQLIGQYWCEDHECGCPTLFASNLTNSTNGFCHCNIWTGEVKPCSADSDNPILTSESFTVTSSTVQSGGARTRELRKRGKKIAKSEKSKLGNSDSAKSSNYLGDGLSASDGANKSSKAGKRGKRAKPAKNKDHSRSPPAAAPFQMSLQGIRETLKVVLQTLVPVYCNYRSDLDTFMVVQNCESNADHTEASCDISLSIRSERSYSNAIRDELGSCVPYMLRAKTALRRIAQSVGGCSISIEGRDGRRIGALTDLCKQLF